MLHGLLGGSDQDLVYAHPRGLGDGVGDGVGDVFGLQDLQVQEAAEALFGVLVGDVGRQFGLDGTRLDDGDPYVVLQELLPQALRRWRRRRTWYPA